MSREIIMGIDVGSSAVKTVILGKNNDKNIPAILGTGLSVSHGLRRGYIINPEEVAQSIEKSVREARKNANINIKQAFVSIDGAGLQSLKSSGSIVVARADNEITENDIKRAVNQSESQLNRASSSFLLNRDILHNFPISYKIDGEQVMGNSPLGMKGEKLEVETLFITCLTPHMNNLVKSMEMAKIQVEDISAAPYVMSHCLLGPREKEVGALLINIGGDTSSIIVFEEGSPVSSEIFPIGSNHITYDIARGFQIPLSQAEEMKLSYGNDSSLKRKLQNIIEPRLNDIFELAENHLRKINRSGLLPAGVILTGGGANTINIEDLAKKLLALPVQSSQPKFMEDPKNPVSNPIWSVAMGLCLNNFADTSYSSSILPQKLGRGAKNLMVRWFKNLLP